MSFLHCHNCNWSQDDFWDPKGYNPFRHDLIQYLTDSLFKDRIVGDLCMFLEMGVDPADIHEHEEGRGYWVESCLFVARELEMKANSIRNMAVKTNEDWKRVRDNFCCPECGSKNWDID